MSQKTKINTTSELSQADIDQLEHVPFLSHVPSHLRAELIRDAVVKTYAKSGLLFTHNEPAENIYILLDGMVNISLYHEDGSQVLIETITPVRTFAIAAVFLQGKYPATAEYTAGSRLIILPQSLFLKRLEQSPETAFSILGSLALWERTFTSQLDNLKLNNASQRVIRYILEHVPDDVTGAYTLELPIDKGMLAKKLGIKKESLSRLLADLAKHGITNAPKTVHIASVSDLRNHLEQTKKKKR